MFSTTRSKPRDSFVWHRLRVTLVWNKSVATFHEWQTAEGWADREVVEVSRVQKDTFKVRTHCDSACSILKVCQMAQFALLIIMSCGFGIPTLWNEPPRAIKGDDEESLSVQEAMQIVSETTLLMSSAPKWIWYLPIKWSVVTATSSDKGY